MVHNKKFCVGLADPSVHELASSGAKRWPGVVRTVVNVARAEKCPPLTTRNILCSSKLSERKGGYQRWASVYGVALAVANVCKAVVNGIER